MRILRPNAVDARNGSTEEEFMTCDARSLEAAHASLRELTAAKRKYLVPMTITFMVGYIGLTVLAGFAKGLMRTQVVGAFNLGFFLIAVNYVLSWVLAILYVRVANRVFDPLVRKAAAAINSAGASA
jgi:uncharacterized membrane protein (DUF485 family)